MGFQVKRYEESGETDWETIKGAWDIDSAVETAAKKFCHEDAEYTDFECFARQVGETEWRKFYVTIESEPVFYASENP